MIIDILKAAVPSEWIRTIVLLAGVLWFGWVANSTWALVETHYTETSDLVRISRSICKAVHVQARLDPAICWRKGEQ